MTFIITLISLLVERFFDWSHLRQWRWFVSYQELLATKLAALPALLLLLIAIFPLVLVVGVLNFFLAHWLYGVLKIFFGATILIYCLGPANFWAQVYKCIAVLHDKDPQPAIQKILGCSLPADSQSFHRALTHAFFVQANDRIFAVFFWFVLLGPAGAVFYRTIDISKTIVKMQQSAEQVQLVLDWLPVRLFTFLFALSGHFTEVFKHWKARLISPPRANDVLLTECGVAALDVLDAERIPEDGTAEKETLSLLDRVFVMALVILAVLVLMK